MQRRGIFLARDERAGTRLISIRENVHVSIIHFAHQGATFLPPERLRAPLA